MKIGSNIQSLQAQSGLKKSGLELSKVYERLATGMRINRASDDAAGLSIASALSADRRVFSQAIRNANDAIGLLNTAAGALSELQGIVARQKELAEQSANGVYGDEQRMAMQTEVAALRTEFNRIIEGTKYNDQFLLNSPSLELTIQTGYGLENTSIINYAAFTDRSVGAGTAASVSNVLPSEGGFTAILTDLNNDGNVDLLRNDWGAGHGDILVALGNGNGTFGADATYSNGSATAGYQLAYNDLNHDGIKDLALTNFQTSSISVLLANANGTFRAPQVISTNSGLNGENRSMSIGDVTGDGHADLVSGDLYTSAIWIAAGNGDGTFRSAVSQAGNSGFDNELFDFDSDGDLDIVIGAQSHVLLNNGTGTFTLRQSTMSVHNLSSVQVGDLNNDGKADLIGSGDKFVVSLGNGDGTFQAAVSYSIGSNDLRGAALGDLNDDGILDVALADTTGTAVHMLIGNGDGTFRLPVSAATTGDSRNVYFVDLNNDFVDELFATAFTGSGYSIVFQNTTSGILQGEIDISEAGTARKMLDKLEIDQERISTGLSAIGAAQSRLEVNIAGLQSRSLAYQEAESRIVDADIALEAANLTRLGLIQNVSAEILKRANLQPSLVLQLLKG